MNRQLAWTDEAWKDYVYWQSQDRNTLKRINKLIDSVRRDPFRGIGKPEALKENLSGVEEVHDQDEDQRNNDPLEEFQGAESLTKHRDTDRSDNGVEVAQLLFFFNEQGFSTSYAEPEVAVNPAALPPMMPMS